MEVHNGAAISLIFRLELNTNVTSFARVASLVGDNGGDIIAVDVIRVSKETMVRDVTINVNNRDHGHKIASLLNEENGITVVAVSDRTFLVHLGGKIEVTPKLQVKNRDDLSRVYTPHVARICEAIHEDPSKAFQLTIKRNTVAVVSDGTAVLGLGDIGPRAAMPVMEGKAMLFKQFANVDAFPICLDTKDPDEIVSIVKAIAPAFGGINLEDIASPRCFYIEEKLKQELDIPVFHDDQHGTAVVLLAGLINATKIVQKPMESLKVVVVGIGAAGVACTKMMLAAGIKNILGVTLEGVLHRGKTYENDIWNWYAEHTNPENVEGDLASAIQGADVFVGVSGPGVLKVEHIKSMAKDPIVFAMANPTPEIQPELAAPYVRVLATGRSDYPNQINNVLCFPGIFKGALQARAYTINEEMKLAAAHAIANSVKDEELTEDYIIPSVFNTRVVKAVSDAVAKAAVASGVARRESISATYNF
ncbi:NAD-dependent malic enzyme [Alicyclobacillus tolerans]|uniref:Malate dehydrogenase (Oxaloacetate-decarboxylating) n=2 Tax=Alicyclobacillus tolerans TaxID=90970 RepID=A0A1M6KEC5_9BACL|nr:MULTISPECIES: NAD-dependent malic enzyme [Alicyclobacillus]MDP9727235.1 malate dehydrogenase (oxaloacetate-decarboxylating) [Alicyclobacillus tengchongensis]QRF22995.1 NAD-dependent malic enzyme [Alicyclobacillus sp. TC]SHJ57301.1 malate dehydrogenase (oxaloacetate-decarboxylating) [Alicyclobacillus montanus]